MPKEKIVEVEVEQYSGTSMPVIKLTRINCVRWGITKKNGNPNQPKVGQKIKIIIDW